MTIPNLINSVILFLENDTIFSLDFKFIKKILFINPKFVNSWNTQKLG